MPLKALSISLALLIGLTACSPHIEHLGPPLIEPSLSEAHAMMPDGAKLPFKFWTTKSAKPDHIIIALHGMNDYSNAFKGPAQFWATQDIATYAYDLRGFGDTKTRGYFADAQTHAQDLQVITALIKLKYPSSTLTCLGESMGGAILLNAMHATSKPDCDQVILSAPASWGWSVMPFYQAWPLKALAHIVPWLHVAPRLNIKPSDNITMLRALSRDPLILKRTRLDAVWGLVNVMEAAYQAIPHINYPLLLLYGKKEDVLPKNVRETALDRLPDRNDILVKIYPNGYHMLLRDLHADQVLADITAYIKSKK
jgi:alpha-beta hydrolase superfamily lysophospholipase